MSPLLFAVVDALLAVEVAAEVHELRGHRSWARGKGWGMVGSMSASIRRSRARLGAWRSLWLMTGGAR